MIKVCVYRGMLLHVLRFLPGTLVLALYFYLALRHPGAIGIQPVYDAAIPQDILSFVGVFLVMVLVIFQFVKSYLLYFPKATLLIDPNGLVLKMPFGKKQDLLWKDVDGVRVDTDSDWVLTVVIRRTDGIEETFYLAECWFLSVFKKPCVNYNFLKLIAIANLNDQFKSKLNPDEIELMYLKSGVKK